MSGERLSEAEIAEVLRDHVWVRHMTDRADCDCNWKTSVANTIPAQRYDHVAHIAAALAARLAAVPGRGLAARVEALAEDPDATEVVAHAINPVATHPLDRQWATEEAGKAIHAVAALLAADEEA